VLQPQESVVAVCPLSVPLRCTLTATDRRVILCTHKEQLVATPWSEVEEVAHDVIRGRHRLRMWTAEEPAELTSRDEAMIDIYKAVSLGIGRWNEEHGIVARFGGVSVTADAITFGEQSCPIGGSTAEVLTGKELSARRPPDTGFGLGVKARLMERTRFLVVEGAGLQAEVELTQWRLDSARSFAATVTALAAKAPPAVRTPTSGGVALTEQLEALAALHEKGQLTDDEFSAAKARLFLA
jgi:hypothetical protein